MVSLQAHESSGPALLTQEFASAPVSVPLLAHSSMRARMPKETWPAGYLDDESDHLLFSSDALHETKPSICMHAYPLRSQN